MTILEKMRAFFSKDIYATEVSGIEILQAEEGSAVCRMPVDRRHSNASGFVMGGAIYTLADFTASVASNAERPVTVSETGEIHYLHAAKCSALTAEATVVFDGRKTNYCEVSIFNENNLLIARASFNGFRILPKEADQKSE